MKTFRLFSMAALALTMAACGSEDNTLETATPAKPGLIPFSATVAPLSGATTRTEYTEVTSGDDAGKINVAWKEGDQIFITRLTPDLGTVGTVTVGKPNDDGSAPLSGNISGADGSEIEAQYPASATSDWLTFTEKYNAQDGTLSGIQDNLDYRKGTGEISVIGGKATLADKLQMKSQIAIWKLTLQNTSGANLNAAKVTIKDGSDVIAATTDISATSEVYMAVPFNTSPATFDNLTIEATTADGTYTYAAPSAVNLSHSTYYQSTVKMARTLADATTSDYGKVVCAAGHLHDAKTAVPAGCTAVGILGKVTETGHGLILALQNATSQNWNTINGWTSVDTYASTTLKLLPDDAARGTNLTSYTTLGETTVSNWAVAQKSDYEAIFINLGSTAGDEDGTTYDGNVNAYITTGVGGAAISGDYWSATGDDSDSALNFRSEYWSYPFKTNSYSVRPVLGF